LVPIDLRGRGAWPSQQHRHVARYGLDPIRRRWFDDPWDAPAAAEESDDIPVRRRERARVAERPTTELERPFTPPAEPEPVRKELDLVLDARLEDELDLDRRLEGGHISAAVATRP
jgi:hypothetical protein